MPKIIVLGDKTSHGGEVVSAWGQDGPVPSTIDGIPVACIGDRVTCPKKGHSGVVIVQGAEGPPDMLGGRPVAREGDKCSCGAVLVSKGQSRSTHGD
ncbi:MAG: PAAR domain-containing protein [Betaproteobacteria bacterium]|nr:PAAR domain-containing protein [Betaproteobacteria bacterium]